jgi:hypothetical protein
MRCALIALVALAFSGCGEPEIPTVHHRWSLPDHPTYARCVERELTPSEAMEWSERLPPGDGWWPWPCPTDWLARCVTAAMGPTVYAYEEDLAVDLADGCDGPERELTLQEELWP